MTKSNKTKQKNGTAPSPPCITDRQMRALHALLAGADDTTAAQVAGVQRPTLNRWKNHDADFRAAMNQARAELADGFLDGLRALYPEALAALRDGLTADAISVRLRAAETVLKAVREPEGDTDPEMIRARWATQRAEAAREKEIARFTMPLATMFD
jgi:hypothetical protein